MSHVLYVFLYVCVNLFLLSLSHAVALLIATKNDSLNRERLTVSDVLLQKVFHLDSLFLNIIVMTLGEIEFNDIFLENDLQPFYIDVRIILFIFLFLMPIVLMNLLVRVAH